MTIYEDDTTVTIIDSNIHFLEQVKMNYKNS